MQRVCQVVVQHAENAAFLWSNRTHAIRAPHYTLSDLARLDWRVEANIDGLRVAGDAGWSLCNKSLKDGEAGELFAAAVLAFESGGQACIEVILSAASDEVLDGIVSALGWLSFERSKPYIDQILASTSPTLRRIAIAASAIQRHNPGRALINALSESDPQLRARALRAVGELGIDTVRLSLDDPDERCRFAAAWSRALLWGDAEAVGSLRAVSPNSNFALQMAIRRMSHNDAAAWIDNFAEDPKLLRTAVVAAGALGDPTRIRWLMEQMNVPTIARVAGEAFTTITGVDLALNDLEQDKPEDFESGPTEDPADEDVEIDPDEHLPWPDPVLIGKWWSANRAAFHNGVRYLLGQPIGVEWARKVLRTGRQRQRAAAALELAIREPGQPLFNVAAPGYRQQQILGLKR
jgi:uncharacterized protein (TIGR02270 family)